MHYTPQQLEEYCNGGLTEVQRIPIEEHIVICAACMTGFLSVAEGLETASIPEPSREFSKRLLLKLYSEKKYKQKTTSTIIKNNVVVCYLIAACITLFIIWSGSMDDMITTVPSLLRQMESGWQSEGFMPIP